MFDWIRNWVNPDLSNFEDEHEPFTELKVTITGTQFDIVQIGQGRRLLSESASLETVQSHLLELEEHLEAVSVITNALNALIPTEEATAEEVEPVKDDPIQGVLDDCGFTHNGKQQLTAKQLKEAMGIKEGGANANRTA